MSNSLCCDYAHFYYYLLKLLLTNTEAAMPCSVCLWWRLSQVVISNFICVSFLCPALKQFHTKIKSGFPEGHWSVVSNLVQRPWHLGLATKVHLVGLLSTPCPLHRYPRWPLMAASSQLIHSREPFTNKVLTSSLVMPSQALRTLVTSKITQYL